MGWQDGKCDGCGGPLMEASIRRRAKWCTSGCRNRAVLGRPPTADLATGTTGAIAELAVAADLLRRGFEVYRAMSPAAVSDLVIVRDRAVFRVQVKTAYRRPDGRLLSAKRPLASTDPSDIWAFVIHAADGAEVVYDGLPGASTGAADEPATIPA